MFEKELRSCMEHGTVYNLATTKEWVKLKRQRFLKHRNPDLQLYGYDYKLYGAIYDDALKISSLFDAMETYAQAYFIYVIECSLIVANYSVRTDNKLIDGGNFPVWATDFFRRSDESPDIPTYWILTFYGSVKRYWRTTRMRAASSSA